MSTDIANNNRRGLEADFTFHQIDLLIVSGFEIDYAVVAEGRRWPARRSSHRELTRR